jgi:4-hydroxythreonine-4-phosphate dehydrogenase
LQDKFANGEKGLMLMVSDVLKVAVATGHVPVKQIAFHLNQEKLVTKLQDLNKTLIEDFGVVRPRIAVLGLNPHAGDNGVLGTEEEEIIIPAIKKANEMGITCFGPYPADGFFGAGSFKSFDAVLAMYHDQGLTPFKCIAMESGVNYTANLPIIRTSPAHGTAYDKVGIGSASEESFRNALYLACDVFNCRKRYAELVKNRLKKQEVEISGQVE